MRRAKTAVEAVLVGLGVPRRRLRRRMPSAVVLAYHNVVPRGERPVGDRSLHLPQEAFAEQLDILAESFDVVPLDGLWDSGDWERPRVAITFDDGYVGALTAGVEELQARSMPCTVMIAPGILGRRCWWDLLSSREGLLDPGLRDRCLWSMKGDGATIVEWASREGVEMRELPPFAIPAEEPALAEWARSPMVALGVHSWSHRNLAALDSGEVREELVRSRKWVETNSTDFVDWLAYPYGLHSPPVVAEARRLFEGALRVEGGLAVVRGKSRGRPEVTPRVNIPSGISPRGFQLRLAGLFS